MIYYLALCLISPHVLHGCNLRAYICAVFIYSKEFVPEFSLSLFKECVFHQMKRDRHKMNTLFLLRVFIRSSSSAIKLRSEN